MLLGIWQKLFPSNNMIVTVQNDVCFEVTLLLVYNKAFSNVIQEIYQLVVESLAVFNSL